MEEDEKREDLEKYERMKMVVKKIMREAKKKTNEEWKVSIADNFK